MPKGRQLGSTPFKQNIPTGDRIHVAARIHLGHFLRQARLHSKLSQDGLGKKADLSGKFVGEVERGEKSVSIDTLMRLAGALRVSALRFVLRWP
jgi:DNA-binding XRE family transcriptional regulator